ncbi:uncharacterized protein G2W53_016555 [Senna tora]|uniref:Uncharacterized protein n=1 Tax=Senna tora TaxID=362788 RepID=A0A834TR25_9FABA|nr:uncharacterized protein G2W53_016555 [Senna tora]
MEEDAITDVDGNSPVRRTRGDATSILWRGGGWRLQRRGMEVISNTLYQARSATREELQIYTAADEEEEKLKKMKKMKGALF